MIASLPPMAFEICAVVAVAAVLRGLTGFGFALAAVPLMSLFVTPGQAVTVAVVMQVMIGFRDIVTMRGHADRPALTRMGLGALIGTPPGILLLGWLDPDAMRVLIALTVCLALPALGLKGGAGGRGVPYAFPAGIASGFFGGLAAMPGPAAVACLLHAGLPAARMRATLMLFFFLTSLIAAPGLWLSGLLGMQEVIVAVIAFPVMLAGTWAGGKLFAMTSEARYRHAAIAVLAAMALTTGVRGFAAYI